MSDALFVLGAGAFLAGVFLWSVPAGLAATGIVFVAVAFFLPVKK